MNRLETSRGGSNNSGDWVGSFFQEQHAPPEQGVVPLGAMETVTAGAPPRGQAAAEAAAQVADVTEVAEARLLVADAILEPANHALQAEAPEHAEPKAAAPALGPATSDAVAKPDQLLLAPDGFQNG